MVCCRAAHLLVKVLELGRFFHAEAQRRREGELFLIFL
jgi:hypothetical protein